MIVIPLAGASRRFADAGYTQPKYELLLAGRPVFDHAVASFEAYFATTPFVFVAGPGRGAAAFARRACERLAITDARIVALEVPTAGQAETVQEGLTALGIAGETSLTIFNIDTFRPGFRFPTADWVGRSDGWLEVFRGAGANWSYVLPIEGPEPLALATAEKQPISDLCCTGLYHFARAEDFSRALAAERMSPSTYELFVAPLYNHLIASGGRIHYRPVDRSEVVFCGTPAEYRALGGVQPSGPPAPP